MLHEEEQKEEDNLKGDVKDEKKRKMKRRRRRIRRRWGRGGGRGRRRGREEKEEKRYMQIRSETNLCQWRPTFFFPRPSPLHPPALCLFMRSSKLEVWGLTLCSTCLLCRCVCQCLLPVPCCVSSVSALCVLSVCLLLLCLPLCFLLFLSCVFPFLCALCLLSVCPVVAWSSPSVCLLFPVRLLCVCLVVVSLWFLVRCFFNLFIVTPWP